MELEQSNFKNINRSYLKEKDTLKNPRASVEIEPRGNFILRQELRNLSPGCSAKCAIICNLILMLVFAIVAIPNFYSFGNTFEFSFDYSICPDNKKVCSYVFDLNITLPKPIYVYYEIHNFYINHREFVKSRNWQQLRGENVSLSSLESSCEGAVYNYEVLNNTINKTSFGNMPLNYDDIAFPCGLIAKSYFRDEFLLFNNKSDLIPINETNIANTNDVKYMFKNREDWKKTQWIDMENEHFMVWMSMMPFKDFRKKWGRIDTTLEPGLYNLTIKNDFKISQFEGNKFFVLSSPSILGTSNFFGIVLVVATVYELMFSIFFCFIYFKNKNNKFSESELEWRE